MASEASDGSGEFSSSRAPSASLGMKARARDRGARHARPSLGSERRYRFECGECDSAWRRGRRFSRLFAATLPVRAVSNRSPATLSEFVTLRFASNRNWRARGVRMCSSKNSFRTLLSVRGKLGFRLRRRNSVWADRTRCRRSLVGFKELPPRET
jgi:hypothetical protein